MYRPRRLILLACLCPLTALAVDHPLTQDVHRELLRFRSTPGHKHSIGFRQAAAGTDATLKSLLVDASSPYSEVNDTPTMINTLWWHSFANQLTGSSSTALPDTLHTLQWQLGLTKARPDIDVDVPRNDAIFRLFGFNVAAQLLKADIDADIFLRASELYPHFLTRGATDAVAVQIVRDLARDIPKARHGELGVKPEVVDRYLRTRNAALISEADARYLHETLSSFIESGYMPVRKDGVQRLPAAWRVARVAGALRDARGYVVTSPCEHGEVRADYAALHPKDVFEKPLCFVDASDRGVHAWYLAEARRERKGVPHFERQPSGFSALLMWVGALLPILDAVAFLEAVEAAVADELVEAEVLAAEEAEEATLRSRQLSCGVPTA